MKLWTGRFTKETDPRVNDFNSSIRFDSRLFYEDIQGSAAHAKMLGECGIISPEEALQICEGLSGIQADIMDGSLPFDPASEDIHSFIEAELTGRIGETGKKLHTARSRNDQVATDFKLYVRGELQNITALTAGLALTLCGLAKEHTETVMPGYTHLVRAQPITLAHHLMAYVQMFLRDISRFSDAYARTEECPLGACALAGTPHPIDRELTARLLGFSRPMQNSADAVSDRDFALEFLACASILSVHLSRLAEEVILWASNEFSFAELDDAFATGSSIMPQKKNPDVAELVRGKAGRVFGDLSALLTVMKGLPLAYNKDMQEDKEAVFDAADTVKLCLSAFTPMVESLKFNRENMLAAAKKGFINATDCADYLVRKGMPFRDAYRVTGRLIRRCVETGAALDGLPLETYREFSELFDKDIYGEIDLGTCVARRNVMGGPAPEEVLRQIAAAEERLAPFR